MLSLLLLLLEVSATIAAAAALRALLEPLEDFFRSSRCLLLRVSLEMLDSISIETTT